MKTVEFIQEAELAAALAWKAAKVSDPNQPGKFSRHADVTEEEHRLALESLAVRSGPAYFAANDVKSFVEEMGWGGGAQAASLGGRAPDMAIAAMLKYQELIRSHAPGGDVGERAEAGMKKLLQSFASIYTGTPEATIQAVQERLDPLFEDGTRLSQHRQFATPSRQVSDPRIDQLAKRLAAGHQPVSTWDQPKPAGGGFSGPS